MQRLQLWQGHGCVWVRVLLSALGFSQRRSVDMNRLALVPQAAEQSHGQVLVAEQHMPLLVLKIGGKESCLATVALLHQFEKNVRLLGT